MRRGLFQVDRAIFEHDFFKNEPFTEREAWIWLVGAAVWSPHRIRTPHGMTTLERGQLSFSIRFLSKKWQWTKSRVETFLKRLKSETMIKTANRTGQNTITICEYETYQNFEKYNRTADKTANRTPIGQQSDKEELITNKELIKKEKEGDYAFCGSVIRLTHVDLKSWLVAFPNIDVRAFLTSRDAWLKTCPPSEQKNWFHTTAAALAKKQQEAFTAALPTEEEKIDHHTF